MRINLNDLDNFIKFDVSTNEVPISQDKTGKDVVVDWFLMDGFDTNETFWVDANGLQMVQKALNQRKEYKYNETFSASSNYYPMTSAIVVRDFNKSTSSDASRKQVTIMTQRSQGASAGMRMKKNIEIMHQRRYVRSNSSRYAATGENNLNDLDSDGKGLQIREQYYMQISSVGKSKQRALQRRIDQPLVVHYSQGYSMPSKFDSSNTTAILVDLSDMEKLSKQIKSDSNISSNETGSASAVSKNVGKAGIDKGEVTPQTADQDSMARKRKEQLDKMQPAEIKEEKPAAAPVPRKKGDSVKAKPVEEEAPPAPPAEPKPQPKQEEVSPTAANTDENGNRVNPQPIKPAGDPGVKSSNRENAEKTEMEQP